MNVYEELCEKMSKHLEKYVREALSGLPEFEVEDVDVYYADDEADTTVSISYPIYQNGKFIATREREFNSLSARGKRSLPRWGAHIGERMAKEILRSLKQSKM